MKDVARLVALLLAVAVVARDFAVAGDSVGLRTATFLLAFFVVAALVMRHEGIVTFSAVALAGHYGAALAYGHVTADYGAPVMAALLVAYLDTADLALALPDDRRVDRAFAYACARRLGLVVGLGATAAAVAIALTGAGALLPFARR